VRGDRVEILVDVGDATRSFEVVATRAGRRVEITIARGTVEVAEVTRSGQAVRSARFMAARVVALVEYPALEPDGEPGPRALRRPPPESQESLDL
jgi:hypothetical protein